MKKRWINVILTAALGLSMLLAGCGTGSGTGSETGTDGTKEEKETKTETKKEDSGTKDSLIMGHWGDPPSLDPNNSLNDCAMRVTTNIYDTLIRMDGHFKAQPCVAESWTISEDGKEYSFKIKEGIKFHNGDELTVDDVVFSIERGISFPKASPSYGKVEGVEKIDEHNVKVILKAPYNENQILANLALPFGPIVNKKYVESIGDEEFGRKPMGTGPYKFVKWTKGEKVVLEANEDYFMGAPSIKKIELVTIADTSAALLNLESGDIDAYCDIQTSDYELAKQNQNIKIFEGDALGYEFLQFNTKKAPFDNVKVRQAIAYALDKESLLEGINDGIGTKIDTVIQPDGIGFTDKIATYDYNLEKAKEMLAEAGFPDGFSCDIHVVSDLYAKYAQVLQSSLAEIGVKAEIKQEELSAFKVTTNGGNYDMAINGCSFTVMDVYEACGDSVMGSKIGDTNNTFYDDPRVNELFDKALVTVDETELAKNYEEILIKLSEDVPLVPFIWRVRNITCNKDLDIPYMDPYAFHYLGNWSWGSSEE